MKRAAAQPLNQPSANPHWRIAWFALGLFSLAGAALQVVAQELPATPSGDRGVANSMFLQDGRFELELEWSDGQGNGGPGSVASLPDGAQLELRSSESTVIEFFGNENWELLLKVLDGRGINGRYWVFLAAGSNVGYLVRVRDTVCGGQKVYEGALGTFQPSTTDIEAFANCESPLPPSCSPTSGVICLHGGRFEVMVDWTDFGGNTGIGRQVTVDQGGLAQGNDSGLFTFYNPDNWEMLVKVLDGCDSNEHFWVFNAATTNLAFTLTVTDTELGNRRRWSNQLGAAAVPFGRTGVFPCEAPPPPPPEGSEASFRLVGSGYNRTFDYSESAGNLIFCRAQNQNLLWVRFARDTNSNGNNGPHMDIDVCRYNGGGTFTPGDPPLLPSCSNGKQFDVFWHDGPATFVNEPTSSPCSLQIDQDGDVLTGTFECGNLTEFDGSGTLDVSNGSFRCTLE